MNRKNIKRYLIDMKNVSPILVSDYEGVSDVYVSDDKHIISATTIAGIFRSFLENKIKEVGSKLDYRYKELYSFVYKETFKEYEKSENGKKKNLKPPSNLESYWSKNYKNVQILRFYDSESTKEITKNDHLYRNHVYIDRELGAASDGSLFDEKLVNLNMNFKMCIEVADIYSEDIYKNLDAEKKEKMRVDDLGSMIDDLDEVIKEFVASINSKDITFSGKSSHGYGRFDVESFYIKNYNLLREERKREYLDTYDVFLSTGDELEKIEMEKTKEDIEAYNFYCDGGFFIDSEVVEDKVSKYFSEDGQAFTTIIPSSSIKGVIRSQCEKIAATLDQRSNDNVNQRAVAEMFGYTKEYLETISLDYKEFETENKKGKLVFYDVTIDKNKHKKVKQTNIKIDRFTGGVYNGAVSSRCLLVIPKESPIKIKIKKRIALSTNQENILEFAFKDIEDGLVKIGSGASTGHGRFKKV